jgi:hypothetical protein
MADISVEPCSREASVYSKSYFRLVKIVCGYNYVLNNSLDVVDLPLNYAVATPLTSAPPHFPRTVDFMHTFQHLCQA